MTAGRSASTLRNRQWGQTLATGIFCVAFLALFQRAIGLGRSIVICDWLSTEELGKWDLAFTFLMAIGPLVVLGVPGAFGRFADGYRRTNRIIRFIQITAVACALLLAASVVVLLLLSGQVGELFGSGALDSTWVHLLIPVLVAVVVFNYLTALMTSLRLHQGFAKAQAFHGIGFALLCLVTVPIFSYKAVGVVASYGIACVISSLAAIFWIRKSIVEHAGTLGQDVSGPSSEKFSRELVGVLRAIIPFAAAIWIATLVANGFRISDRLLIMHLSASGPTALYLVGQYHAARIFPRLLSQFAMTLAAVITPHLAEDWDCGRHDRAAEQLASMLKFVSLGFCAMATLILVFAPWLFSMLMQDKFDLAIELLPWALASGVTYSLAFVLQNAFWCSKRAWWTSLAFLIGLFVNVAAGLVLFPWIGIEGIVISTFLATSLSLCFLLAVASRNGFGFSVATYVVLALPSALVAGPAGCALIFILLAYSAAFPNSLVTADERARLRRLVVRA